MSRVTHYEGTIANDPLDTRLVFRCFDDGTFEQLEPRLDLRNHSPDGFAWGYNGSGPAQLALAILADHLQDDERALQDYQRFKARVFAPLGRRCPVDADTDGNRGRAKTVPCGFCSMRFTKRPRPANEDTRRKRLAAARRQQRQRNALPLLAPLIAERQPTIDRVMAGRAESWARTELRG